MAAWESLGFVKDNYFQSWLRKCHYLIDFFFFKQQIIRKEKQQQTNKKQKQSECVYLILKALFHFSYLNTTFIKKQKFSDADLNYGGFSVDNAEHMLEIGEVSWL